MMTAPTSPYERALGRRMALLHPELQRYFSTIRSGTVGVGVGVFAEFGTPHRWLEPALSLLQRRHVLLPGWYEDVPFRIVNRTVEGRAVAVRRVPGDGTWTMRDSVYLAPHGRVVDTIGQPALFDVSFDIDVRDGELHLSSHAVAVRWGRSRIRLPRPIAPRIHLRERYDDVEQCQYVDLTVRVALLGVIYRYRGTFSYRIEED
ncbi:DUF4166 domain-containing protein [Bogoriella caseilytica]|uniref:Uncharacterized protein DUF4166 n=1 Tax=Bogoriella caseilytica TaxID=56055 RepID=A0A3N2BA86_9MICO|nr:DUF4166 domain-containing protein [Bogoriella caseilytica]ROR72165.1 uncharacterized protein DUF4166 [Bogoriella caseilytica]